MDLKNIYSRKSKDMKQDRDNEQPALIDTIETNDGKYICIWNMAGWWYKLTEYDDATQTHTPIGKTYGDLKEAKAAAEEFAKGGMISDSKWLKDEEYANYEGYDLTYERMYDEAYDAYNTLLSNGQTYISWSDVANEMGIRLNTLNKDDYDMLHDAIQDVLCDSKYNNIYND